MAPADLRELIALLACGDESEEEVARMAAEVESIGDDPDMAFMAQIGADSAMYTAVGLRFALADLAAVSDKIDELHEQIADMFADPLPDFPQALWGEPVDRYFEWLDGLLAQRATDKGGYRLLMLDTGLDDNMVAFVVLRNDVGRILAFSEAAGLRMDLAAA